MARGAGWYPRTGWWCRARVPREGVRDTQAFCAGMRPAGSGAAIDRAAVARRGLSPGMGMQPILAPRASIATLPWLFLAFLMIPSCGPVMSLPADATRVLCSSGFRVLLAWLRSLQDYNLLDDLDESALTNIIFAWRSGEGVQQHPTTQRGTTSVNFLTGDSCSVCLESNDFYALHGALILLAWMVVAPYGLYQSRYAPTRHSRRACGPFLSRRRGPWCVPPSGKVSVGYSLLG